MPTIRVDTTMRYVLFAVMLLVSALEIVPAEPVQHEVRPGETLYGIAREYGITLDELSRLNGIESPDLLLPGTILTVGRIYRVKPGDTLFGIARSNDTTVAQLREMNSLQSSTIMTGQRLRLPLDSAPRVSDVTATTREERSPEKPAGESAPPETKPREEAIPVALSIGAPIPFADGGAWPVAGARMRLEGKLPGVLIRAERGTPVSAIASGRVVYAGPHSSFGNVVFVQSIQGYIYVYGGQERVLVGVGDTVSAGSTLGMVGTSPDADSAGLYFSVWRNDRFVDPEAAPRG
jgi:murein DD-endopeptidase MepM/ murein hydrolase activator NlpD